MDQLPIELIRRIFVSCHRVTCFTRPSKNPISSSLLLSHVDQLWREIALSTPQLWNCVMIHTNHWDTSDDTYCMLRARTEACLQRSRDYPLIISIFLVHDKFGDVVELLLSHFNRWHTLKIHAPPSIHKILRRAENLNSLTSVYPFLFKPSLECFRLSFGMHTPLPSLKTMYTSDSRIDPSYFSLDHLETWIGDQCLLRDITIITTKTRNLKNLVLSRLDHLWHPRNRNPEFQPGSMPSIESFSCILSNVASANIPEVIPHFPSLRRLVIREAIAEDLEDLTHFFTFVKSLPHTLTHLTFSCTMSHAHIRNTLLFLPPSVTHVQLDLSASDRYSEKSADIVDSMINDTSNPLFWSLLPKLQHIIIKQQNCFNPTFIPFLTSRSAFAQNPFVTPVLQSASFSYVVSDARAEESISTPPAGDMELLRGLASLGLLVRIQIAGDAVFGTDRMYFDDLEREMEWDKRLKGEMEYPFVRGGLGRSIA